MKLKQNYKIVLSIVVLLSLIISGLSIQQLKKDPSVKATDAANAETQYVKIEQAIQSSIANQVDVLVTFSPYLTEEIRIPVPDGLTYQETLASLQSENKVSLDTEKKELVIQPFEKTNQSNQGQSSELATSENVPVVTEFQEQSVLVSFTVNQTGEYTLKAVTSYEDSVIHSDELTLKLPTTSNPESTKPETDPNQSSKEQSKNSQANEADVPVAVQSRMMARAAGEVEVSTWAEFKAAYDEPTTTKIIMKNEITASSATSFRTTPIEIDGGGFLLEMRNYDLRVNNPSVAGSVFHIHDMIMSNNAYNEAFVNSGYGSANTRNWKFRLGSIVTKANVQRVIRAYHAEVTMYGNNNLDTRAENFYVGSMVIEPGTKYIGNVNYYNFSVIWFVENSSAGETGASQEFTIGEGANVKLGQTQTGTAYPAVYQYYKSMTIGENAVFNVNMPGNAVRFDLSGSTFTAKKGSITNLTSKLASGAVVNFNASNSVFKVEEGAYFYTIGVSSVPLVNIASGSNNVFDLSKPAQYDIRNLGTSSAVGITGAANKLSISDSDIDLWNMGVDVLGPSSLTYALVGNLTATGPANTQVVTSTEPALQTNFRTNKFRRISGMNQNPIVELSPVTDANLTVKGRVQIGTVPDNNGSDEDGNITYIPVYASAGQAKVTVTADDGSLVQKDLVTDKDGYISYKVSSFYKAGTTLSATAVRGPYLSEEPGTTVVSDVTPPKPAELTGKFTIASKKIKGINGEPGATVTYTINGVDAKIDGTIISAIVQPDGTWEIPTPGPRLTIGDKVQIFLTDTVGNKNPVTQKTLYDAIFPPATTVTVADGELSFISAPKDISFGEELPLGAKTTQYPIAGMDGDLVVEDTRADKLSWTLTAKMDRVLTSATNKTLPQAVRYSKAGKQQILGTSAITIYENTNVDDDPVSITNGWIPNGDGLSLSIDAGEAYPEEYTGSITWTLQDTP